MQELVGIKCFTKWKCVTTSYLVGAGLADPDGVRGREMVLPNADRPVFPFDTLVMVEPTDNRDGRVTPPADVVDVVVVKRR